MAETIRTTCAYCGVGCGVLAAPQPDGSVAIAGDPDHPANFGRLCSKGSALGETLALDDRLLHPEIGGRRVSWDDALGTVADRFRETIDRYGPESVAFYVSGQILTEDYYVANKLMKGFIGAANIDTNSRLCMASSVAGHKRAFGSDTVPGTYEDLELADLVVLAGSNLAWCHPVLYQRLAAAREKRPSMKVVLIDPRRTATAGIADLHLAIAPDGDTALFSGLLRHLFEADATDGDYINTHTSGFDEALAAAACFDGARVAAETGLAREDMKTFYRLFAATEKVVTVYSQGVNQSVRGTDKVNAIINCHLATGRLGQPGMGPFSVTGQPNAMGGREVGGLANMLAAHMALEDPGHRALVQRFWNAPRMADKPGLKAVEMFNAVADGRIKAIWIMATNPVDSLPDADAVAQALRDCPFVVVSDVVAKTDTIRHADVKLPSTGWGEKDGTVTNSERRISRQRAFLPAPDEARADWWQLAEVARRMGFGEAFAYGTAADIFREHAALSAFENDGKRDFDIGAYQDVPDADYRDLRPFQWPQGRGAQPAQKRFFTNGGFFTADGRARFVALRPSGAAMADEAYPLTLNTGRVRDHWHTMTRTGKSPRLSAHMAEPFAEIHPEDAARLSIDDADLVRVESRHGAAVVRALVTARQRPGSVFVPMHWTAEFAALARVCALVAPVTDPLSGQPASKNVPIRLERFEAGCYGFAICARRPNTEGLDYWALARADGGWRIELAVREEMPEHETFFRRLLELGRNDDGAEILAYRDARRGDHRMAAFEDTRLLGALYLSRTPVAVAREWVTGQFSESHADPRSRFLVVAGRGKTARPDAGATVCSCFGIGINQIAAAVRTGCTTVEAVGRSLSAGTNCGSCRAEIKEIIDAHRLQAAE
ncbi:assimilatory nitrate reductase (NADH) subunit alpha [Nitratireductor indicus C115]|uniref:nitrate reductase (cytochrome) n=1 Tax=Nitratireductor indicus C115 TaxID=1231190 RepID=K2N6U9_9HYPH|nr:nitrate reductase [Nitratireductor indicus]EKF43203.1 assimilatory nitrate reductase (NADH) subunit alpha [Nitratireductor indicus C115]SFQ53654.1 assimilatory nitrate reductase catalytic subunit [Nitratireductor indicus]